MSAEPDPALKEFMRQRLVQLADWREVIAHGSDDERQKLVASLREIDLVPLFSTLDEDEDEVRTTASEHRTALALDELQRMTQRAISAGDFDLAATYLDLRLSVEDANWRDNAGRIV